MQRSDPALHAVVEYAKNGDPGALRYLRERFPPTTPFGAWAARQAANQAVAEDAGEDPPPAELVEEVRIALERLAPAERQALREALNP